jgi:hypothetical protein
MSDSLRDTWVHAWTDIWEQVEQHPDFWPEMYMDLYPSFAKNGTGIGDHRLEHFPEVPAEQRAGKSEALYFEISNDPRRARAAFQHFRQSDFENDRRLILFLEDAIETIETGGGPLLASAFSSLTKSMLLRYNCRFRVAESPFKIVSHFAGAFAAVVEQVAIHCQNDDHAALLLAEFRESFEALSSSQSNNTLKTCILKACTKTEGIAAGRPDATKGTLGELCKECNVWPHKTIRESVSSLYGFCSNYPGIRHAGNHQSALRAVSLKDAVLISMNFILATGYFIDSIDFEEIVGMTRR